VLSRPPIDREALHATVGSTWARVDVVESTESTNADLLADVQAPDRAVLVAEVQTAGRGRLDRTWQSPPGAGLTFSVLLRPAVPAAAWGWLPLLAGVAVHKAVAAHVACSVKWPNDLLDADGGKLAGILAQTAGDAVVVGIGVNVTTQRDELPVPTASSLALLGATPDRTALLAAILGEFATRYGAWSAAGGDASASGLAESYRAVCSTIGSEIEVQTPGPALRGTAVDVDESGRLVLEVAGERHTVAAGDVTHVREAG
jgi:BirA family biotin operon repressor/biotin-[acetyl-CoA-carboxylase] ligase